MKKIFKKLKKIAGTKVGRMALSAVPGGNIIKNLVSDDSGVTRSTGKWDKVMLTDDISIDVLKAVILLIVLGTLFGWFSADEAEAAIELLKDI